MPTATVTNEQQKALSVAINQTQMTLCNVLADGIINSKHQLDREVRNKDTGIDLSVPTFKEVKGMLSSTFFYRVVVVSNLQVFKSPKHKESDTVQFMVEKKFGDFEDLYDALNVKFSGTVLPPLPRKVLMVNEPIARARRSELEHFVKFIASVPKISTSSVVLEFLGVGSMKAGAFRKGEVGDHGGEEGGDQNPQEGQEDEVDAGTKEPETSLFDEDNNENEEELFAEADLGDDYKDNTQLFEAPELGGGITEEDDSLFLPDAVVEKKVDPKPVTTETDPSLYQIDDDLEQIMKIDVTKKTKRKSEETTEKTQKPSIKPKPALKPKPGAQPKTEVKPESNLSSDDILSYIQDNAEKEAEVDLFS